MRTKLLGLTITIILIFSTLGTQVESADLADAEKTAWHYMTSMLRGDVEMSFSLMSEHKLNMMKVISRALLSCPWERYRLDSMRSPQTRQ